MKNKTANDWKATLTALSQQKAWEEVWRLVTEIPLKWSIRFLLQLKEAAWQPERETERKAFSNLVRLAEECSQIKAPTPGKFVHCYTTLKGFRVISPDGSMLISSSQERQGYDLQLWSLLDGVVLKILSGHTDVITSVVFSPNEHMLATGSGDQTVRLWSMPDGILLKVLQDPTSMVLRVKMSPDGQVLAGMERNGTLWLWSLPDGVVLKKLEGVRSFMFNSDGKLLVTEDRVDTVLLWSLPDVRAIKSLKGHPRVITHLTFSPDGQFLVTGDASGIVGLWNLSEETVKTLTGHLGIVAKSVFSPDGQLLVTGDSVGRVRIWSLPDGNVIKPLTRHGKGITTLAFSPDGQLLITGDKDGMVRLWHLPNGDILNIPKEHSKIRNFVISPDGRILVSNEYKTGSDSYRVRVWDISEGILLGTFEDSYADPIINSGGRILVIGEAHNRIKILSLPNCRVLNTLKEHVSSVHRVSISSDGEVLVSTGTDGTKLWRLGWVDIKRVVARHSSARDLQFVEEKLRTDDLIAADHSWLELLSVLTCRHLTRQADTILQEEKRKSITFQSDGEIERLLYMCYKADTPDIAIQICKYLVIQNHPEAIDTLCARWMETREPQLAELISQAGYVASSPLIVRIYSALQAGRDDLIIESGAAVVSALLEACEDTDQTIAERARQVVMQLLDLPEAQEEICRLVIEEDHPIARELVLAEQYTPHDVHRRVLLYALTEQWEKYEQLDVEQHLLNAIFLTIPLDVRKRLASCIRRSGRVEWISVIAGIRQEKRVREMNDDEWESTLVMLSEHNAWEMLWRLAQIAPAERSVHLLLQLKEAKRFPTQNVEQTVFRELLHLAEYCGRKHPKILKEGISCSATLKEHHICVLCAAISPDGKMLVSGDRNGVIYFWHLPENAAPKILNTIVAACNVRGVEVLLKKGTSLFDRFVERQNHLVDLRRRMFSGYDNEQIHEMLPNILNDSDAPCWRDPVGRLAISRDGQKLIIQSRYLWFWQLSDDPMSKILKEDPNTRDFITDLAISPDSKVLTTRTYSGTIEQWSLPDGTLLKTLERKIEIENCMTLMSDGQIMVSGNRDGTVRIWRLSDGLELQSLEEHTASVGCLVMSSDGQLLASGSEDGTIRLWNMPKGTLLNTLEGHTQTVTCLVMNHDGKLLASGSNDHTIRVWSLPEGKLLQTLEGHTDRISCLAMSADGHVLASGSHDHTVRLWNLKWADLRRLSPDQLNVEDLKFIEKTLQQDKITESQQTWLEFLLVLARWQKRFEVDLGEAPQGIPGGEFDVEIERNT